MHWRDLSPQSCNTFDAITWVDSHGAWAPPQGLGCAQTLFLISSPSAKGQQHVLTHQSTSKGVGQMQHSHTWQTLLSGCCISLLLPAVSSARFTRGRKLLFIRLSKADLTPSNSLVHLSHTGSYLYVCFLYSSCSSSAFNKQYWVFSVIFSKEFLLLTHESHQC